MPGLSDLQNQIESVGQFLPNSSLDYLEKIVSNYTESIKKQLDVLDDKFNLSELENELEDALKEKNRLTELKNDFKKSAEKIKLFR